MTYLFHVVPVLAQQFKFTDGMLVLGVVLITTSMLMMFRKRRKSRAPVPTSLETVERMRQQRGMRGDLEELMVEIEQLSKRFATQLNAKSIELEQLIEEADQRIAQLQQVRGQPGSAVRDTLTMDAYSPSPGSGSPASQTPADDPLTKSVYELADQGLTPEQIAQRVGEHVGKVELILALRNA